MGGSIDKNVLKSISLLDPWRISFLDFTEERYSIYLKKESGIYPPWTDNITLQKYKFTNIFREDDTVSKWIFKWVNIFNNDLKAMVANLIYARLCNKPSTMEATGYLYDGKSWQDPLKFIATIDHIGGGKTKAKVNKNAVWKGPYQVAGTFKSRLGYPYREHLIAYHIPKTIDKLIEVIINHHGTTLNPTLTKMNEIWGYDNNMVFTQVLLDLTYLRSDLISPACVPPVLSGVEPVANMLNLTTVELIDRAQNEWNTNSKYKNRLFYPKDAEHSLCEWRKYLCWHYKLSLPRHYYPSNS